MQYGKDSAAASKAIADAASKAGSDYATTAVTDWDTEARAGVDDATSVANAYRTGSTTYSTALTNADAGEQIAGAGRQAGLTNALASAANTFATDIGTEYQTKMTSWVSGLGAGASDYATYLSSSMAATSAQTSAVLGATMTYISASVTAGQTATTSAANLGQGISLGLIGSEDGAESSVISANDGAAKGSIGATVTYENAITGAVSSFESSTSSAQKTSDDAMTDAQGKFQKAIDKAHYENALAIARTKLLRETDAIDANVAAQQNQAASAQMYRKFADAEADYYKDQAKANFDREDASINASTTLVNGAIGAGTGRANTEVGNRETVANAGEGATHTVTTAYINADHGWTTGVIGVQTAWNTADMAAESGFRTTAANAGDTAATALRTAGSTFVNASAQTQLTKLTNAVNGMVGTTTTTYFLSGGTSTAGTMSLTREQADFVIAQATADKAYISSAVSAGDTLGSTMQGARASLRSTIWSASDSVRSAEVGASAAYATAVASYIQTVNNTIEGAVHTFNNARITADAKWQRDTNTAMGNAMQSLVTAEGNSMKRLNTATRDHANAIADAYKGEMGGATGNSTDTLYTTLLAGGPIDIDNLINDPNAGSVGDTTTGDPADLQAPWDAADAALASANSTSETTRVGDVTAALGTLDTDLGTADSTWETDMGAAGAALGSALDGIADFDWSNVTTYITTVTNARRGAETSVLNAQLGFVTSYYSALGAYTSSMATAGVSHATAYAQATADYYVATANAALAADPGNATLQARASAFAAFATSYVSNITTAAQNAANAATTAQANANAASLATITAEVTAATTAINEFYDDVVADNASPPPVDTDADDDGVPDPVTPSATQTMAAQVTTASAENAAGRATIQTGLAPLAAVRPTGTTNTYGTLTETDNNNTNTTQQQQQQQSAPPVGPSGLAQNNARFQLATSAPTPPPTEGDSIEFESGRMAEDCRTGRQVWVPSRPTLPPRTSTPIPPGSVPGGFPDGPPQVSSASSRTLTDEERNFLLFFYGALSPNGFGSPEGQAQLGQLLAQIRIHQYPDSSDVRAHLPMSNPTVDGVTLGNNQYYRSLSPGLQLLTHEVWHSIHVDAAGMGVNAWVVSYFVDCAIQFAPNGFSPDAAYMGNISEVVAYAIGDTVLEFIQRYPNYKATFQKGGVPSQEMRKAVSEGFQRNLEKRMKARTTVKGVLDRIGTSVHEAGPILIYPQ